MQEEIQGNEREGGWGEGVWVEQGAELLKGW